MCTGLQTMARRILSPLQKNFFGQSKSQLLVKKLKQQKHVRCIYTTVDNYKIAPDETSYRHGQYNVGMFGIGRIAKKVHLQNVLNNPRLNLQWIVDDSEDALSSLHDTDLYMPTTRFFRTDDVHVLLQDPSLDAVVVTSPTSTHADLICRSLKAGKSVLTEKPCAESYDEIKTCFDIADQENKVLLTGFQRRFDPSFQDLKKIIEERSLGDLKLLRFTSRDSPKPSYEFMKSTDVGGCSAISDMAVHDIDTSVWLTSGETPISVYSLTHAHDSIMNEIGQPDIAVLLLKYESGLISLIDIDRDSVYGYDIRIEVFGTEGMTTVENPRESTSVTNHQHGASVRRLFNSFPERFEKAFTLEVQHFVDCLDVQITCAENALLPWTILSNYRESYIFGELYKGLQDESLGPNDWSFPTKVADHVKVILTREGPPDKWLSFGLHGGCVVYSSRARIVTLLSELC